MDVLEDINTCIVCQSKSWVLLPGFHEPYSVTTAGELVNSPYGKAECENCGLVQRIAERRDIFSEYYRNKYAKYYQRAGSTSADLERYKLISKTIFNFMNNGVAPKRILDVGCGNGFFLNVLREYFLDADFEGVDPSVENSRIASERGFTIIKGELSDVMLSLKKYDLLISVNVIQHVKDPIQFLKNQAQLLNEQGKICILCPDASHVNNEILWVDQKFSFEPKHLRALFHATGLREVFFKEFENENSLSQKQLFILEKNTEIPAAFSYTTLKKSAQISSERYHYLDSWKRLDCVLLERCSQFKRVFHFGAGMWTFLMRNFCPKYWHSITACIVDHVDQENVFDKNLVSVKDIELSEDDVVVLGVHPQSQLQLAKRFLGNGVRVVSWSDIIQR